MGKRKKVLQATPTQHRFGYRADRSKMPEERPVWEMTAQEFANNPPSREWFNWFGWPEGYHYCHDSHGYALQTGYLCCIKKARRDGHILGGYMRLTKAQRALLADIYNDGDYYLWTEPASTDNPRTLDALVNRGLIEWHEHRHEFRMTIAGVELITK